MKLFLWRHADAKTGTPDRERSLSKKGQEQALLTARWLDTVLPADPLIFVSPARRTRQTADTLARDYTIHDSLILGSNPKAILSATGWPKGEKNVLLVGHQPLLGYIASLLLCGRQQEWHIEKSNVWWLEKKEGDHHGTILNAVISPLLLNSKGSLLTELS